jgi:hypothetical protein
MPEKMPDTAEFQIRLPTESQPIYFDHTILADIRKILWLRASGKEEAVEIDAHIGWIQCKVAAALVVWDGRSTVEEEDWRLAKMIVDTSCKVRDNLLEMLRKQKEEEEDSKLAKRVHDKVTLENANRKVIHYAKDLAKKVRDAGRMSNSDLRRKMWKPARVFFDDAIQWAEGQRWVEQDGQAGWKPGPNGPD